MNKIEEIISKFIPIKNKLPINLINELTKQDNKTILCFLNYEKNSSLSNNKKEKKIGNKNNINNQENNPKSKSTDKNKFFTKKYPEQNVQNINNNIIKEVSPINIPNNISKRNNIINNNYFL